MGIWREKYSKDGAGIVQNRHKIWSQETQDSRFHSAIAGLE